MFSQSSKCPILDLSDNGDTLRYYECIETLGLDTTFSIDLLTSELAEYIGEQRFEGLHVVNIENQQSRGIYKANIRIGKWTSSYNYDDERITIIENFNEFGIHNGLQEVAKNDTVVYRYLVTAKQGYWGVREYMFEMFQFKGEYSKCGAIQKAENKL